MPAGVRNPKRAWPARSVEQCGTCGRYYMEGVIAAHVDVCVRTQFVLTSPLLATDGRRFTRQHLTTEAHRLADPAHALDAPELPGVAFDVDAIDGLAIKSASLTPAHPALWQLAGQSWAHAQFVSPTDPAVAFAEPARPLPTDARGAGGAALLALAQPGNKPGSTRPSDGGGSA